MVTSVRIILRDVSHQLPESITCSGSGHHGGHLAIPHLDIDVVNSYPSMSDRWTELGLARFRFPSDLF